MYASKHKQQIARIVKLQLAIKSRINSQHEYEHNLLTVILLFEPRKNFVELCTRNKDSVDLVSEKLRCYVICLQYITGKREL